jgi:5-methylcytosine-specific restriction endonuclease McrA
VCATCGSIFTAKNPLKKYCSNACSVQAYQQAKTPHRQKPMTCKQCGHTFVPRYRDKRRAFCSDLCLTRYNRPQKKARKRAKENGVYYEYVNPLKVFKRDGWRCQLCGRKLKPKDRGTLKDAAPELDHIIPWASGGEHSYRNTQCACRKCNSEKGARELGQLRLFG